MMSFYDLSKADKLFRKPNNAQFSILGFEVVAVEKMGMRSCGTPQECG
jgi:hypothetical protein